MPLDVEWSLGGGKLDPSSLAFVYLRVKVLKDRS